MHQASQIYDSPRVHAELKACGYRCNEKRVARLMHWHGLRGKGHQRKQVITTDSHHALPVAENVLNQQFVATAPN